MYFSFLSCQQNVKTIHLDFSFILKLVVKSHNCCSARQGPRGNSPKTSCQTWRGSSSITRTRSTSTTSWWTPSAELRVRRHSISHSARREAKSTTLPAAQLSPNDQHTHTWCTYARPVGGAATQSGWRHLLHHYFFTLLQFSVELNLALGLISDIGQISASLD